jgi:hypothetical protein
VDKQSEETQDKPKRKPGRPKKQKPAEQAEQPKELSLTQVEVLSLRLYHSENERSQKAFTLAGINRAAYLKQIDPQENLSKFEAEMRASAAASEEARKRYQDVMQSAEARLGIKLSEYTFDGDTGLLRKIQ